VGAPEPILEHRKMTLRERLRAPDSYGLLLVLILASIVASAAFSGTHLGRVVTIVFLGGTLLFAMRTSRAGHRFRQIASVAVPLMVVAAAVFEALSNASVSRSITAGFSAALVVAALSAIFSRLATHSTISIQTVLGALSMYLLLGLLFASVFALLASASGDAFFAQGAAAESSVNYIYFSYVTIATVGYGDLSAAGNLGKMLSASEALVGQLFLVTVVALLVTNLGKARRRPAAGNEDDASVPGSVADQDG
jgi:Ion channel